MKLIDFFKTVGKLKTIKRTGWINKNIPNPESIADHSFRTAIMAMVLAPKLGVDVEKAIKMALIHDIGEAKIGDVVTMYGKQKLANYSDKLNLEATAFKEIFSLIDGDEYVSLFNEFEGAQTKEAKLVKELDKLEMAMQAFEYEKQYRIDLEPWFENSRILIQSKEIRAILEEIEKLR
jgi:5'-deoxynucleotidase YfbR-like HD superfamily hydrolase